MTRGEWYAQRYGGGWRTARKNKKCGQLYCFTLTKPGEKYFDTSKATTWPKTLCICAACANEKFDVI